MPLAEVARRVGLSTTPCWRRINRLQEAGVIRARVALLERKALNALGLETDANATDIKAKFKVLVKRHHPDANGGDRSCEDRLREIIQAYNYLKSVGYC